MSHQVLYKTKYVYNELNSRKPKEKDIAGLPYGVIIQIISAEFFGNNSCKICL